MAKKAPTKKVSATRKKPAKKVVRAARTSGKDTVDFYPNRMTVAVSALAGTLLVLLAIIAVLGVKG